MAGDQCITVLDTGETEDDISHCGDPWLPEDELARVLAGESLSANVLTADDFGVWVSGIAPVRDAAGTVVAAVTRRRTRRWSRSAGSLPGDRSHTLAAMLQAAAIRFSRAEVEAITDGLTGLYNHRYLHERLAGGARARPAPREHALAALLRLRPVQDLQRRPTATRPATPPWRASPASSRPTAGAPIWRRATAARSSCSCSSTRTPREPSSSPRHLRSEIEAVERARRSPPDGQHRHRHLPRRRRRPRRAPRQGRLGDVCGQARRTQPRARLLRRPGARRDLAFATRPVKPGKSSRAHDFTSCEPS